MGILTPRAQTLSRLLTAAAAGLDLTGGGTRQLVEPVPPSPALQAPHDKSAWAHMENRNLNSLRYMPVLRSGPHDPFRLIVDRKLIFGVLLS